LNYSVGTLIEGFDSAPFFLMPYGPRYYPQLLESYGLRKAQDLYAYYANVDMLPESTAKLEPISDQIVERYNIRLRKLNRKRLYDDVLQFISLYNASLVGTWGYEPMSQAEAKHMAAGLKHLLIPDVTAAAEIDGRMVGAAFALPDYNPTIKAIDGRLLPWGFLRMLAQKRKIKRFRLLAANVLPEYQLHGIGLVLLRSMVPAVLERGLQEVEYSWVSESNTRSRGSLEKGGTRRYKTYRVYDWDPGDPETA
jgi:GNAT superfamily N-acetyltransferase